MSRRRSVPWLHRYSRVIMGAIAVVGALITAYLTFMALKGKTPVCPSGQAFGLAGCDVVLNSAYAKLGGLPLSLFGFVAYLAMIVFALSPYLVNPDQNKSLRSQLEEWTWKLLLIGGSSMAVFSGYLIYVSLFTLHAECVYCLSSAACSVALFILSIIGHEWEEMGQLFFTSIIVIMITLVGSMGLYAQVPNPNLGSVPTDQTLEVAQGGRLVIPEATTPAKPPKGWDITTTSGKAEIALAEYLTANGIKMYGAFWCPHCYEQKQLFGKEAFAKIKYIECDPKGQNPQTDLCQKAGIQGFPSWEIKGKIYPGTYPLEKLAELAGYKGPTNFKYTLPGR